MEPKTHWKQLTNPDYIGAYALEPGKDLTVQIQSVAKQMVKGSDGKEEECIVAQIKGQKPMILNATNCKTITKLTGTPYVEEWKGVKVTLYTAQIKAFGEVMDALRIRPTKPELPELTPNHPKWNDAKSAIATGQVTMEKLLKNYRVSTANQKLLTAK